MLYLIIDTPNRITANSKTLIGNIFYNNATEKITAGNSVTDYLTQFLIYKDEATSFEDNRKKVVPKIWKFGKENFVADLTQIGLNNYFEIYKNDTELSFELFLKKIIF